MTIRKDSGDLVAERIKTLKQLFPEIFAEGRVDPDKLRGALGDMAESSKERYSFTWAGRARSMSIRDKLSQGTLTPSKKESVDFDISKNIFVEGDNLEILKIIRKSYEGLVKMIYIDPPYNTGNDFIYSDDYTDPLAHYLTMTGQKNTDGTVLTTNPETSGRYHSSWLSMMWPRLYFARQLLTDDGLIFVNIDDHEVYHLRILMNEIFGQENFVAELPLISNLKGNNDQFGFAGTHEYVIVYSKSIENAKLNKLPIEEEEFEDYELSDTIGKYKQGANLRATGKNGPREKRPNLWYPIYVSKSGDRIGIERKEQQDFEVWPLATDGKEMSWRWEKQRVAKDSKELYAEVSSEKVEIYKKQRLSRDDVLGGYKPKSILYKPEYSSTSGMKDLEDLMPGRLYDNPKAVALLKDLVTVGADSESIVLDFFAGSGTMAQAVLELNHETGAQRRFIMIQWPELTPRNSNARKAGHETIAEIGKERIRRVISKLRNAYAEGQRKANEDLGFKVLKLSQSNSFVWDHKAINDLESLKAHIGKSAQGASAAEKEALIFELMLREGFELDSEIKYFKEADNTFVRVSDSKGVFWMCFDNEIKDEAVLRMSIGKNVKLIVFDSSLQDSQKTNLARNVRIETI